MKKIAICIIIILLVNQVKSICHEHCQYCDDDGNTCLTCRHHMYLYDGTCVDECPNNYIEIQPNWVFDFGHMIGKKCELPLNSEHKFMVAWGDPGKGGSSLFYIFTKKNILLYYTRIY